MDVRPLTGPTRIFFYNPWLHAGACMGGTNLKFYVFWPSYEGPELKEFGDETAALEFIDATLKTWPNRERPLKPEDFKLIRGSEIKLIAKEKVVSVAIDRSGR